jgi:hypothetical protein
MAYTACRPFQGDFDKALDLAIAALTALGFRLDERTADFVRLTGPGMNSNRQSPLVGASQLDIRLRQGQLELAADLGAAERMMRFARIFPIALNGGLALVFLAVFGTIFAGRVAPLFWLSPVIGVTLLNGVVWAVLGPWIARSIHQRTCRGLDALLSTMVVTGQQSAKADLAPANASFSAK